MSANWPKVSLADIYDIRSGLSKPASAFGSGFPFLTFKEVFNNYFVPEILTNLVESSEAERKAGSIKRGDVFLTRTSETLDELGMSCVSLTDYENATFNGFTKRLRPKVNSRFLVCPEYIGYYLRSAMFRRDMLAFSTMSTRASLNNEMIGRLKVLLPPLSIQERIAWILGCLDEKIDINQRVNQTLEDMMQAIFKSWFVDFEPVKAKIIAKGQEGEVLFSAMRAISGKTDAELNQMPREQYDQLATVADLFPEEMESSDLGDIPKNWVVSKVETLLARLPAKTRYTKDQVSDYGVTPVFEQGASIVLGYHNSAASYQASMDNPFFIFGDHTCVTRLSCQPFDISQNVIPLQGRSRPTLWVYFAVKEKQKFQEYRRHWMELISKDVVVAPVEICLEFVRKVSIFQLQIEANERQLLDLRAMRETLLPALLSGELSIAELQDESTQ